MQIKLYQYAFKKKFKDKILKESLLVYKKA